MKKGICILLALTLLLALTGCGMGNAAKSPGPSDSGTEIEGNAPLTIVLFSIPSDKLTAQNAYATQLLRDKGFDITFETCAVSQNDYLDDIKDYVRAHLNTDSLFILTNEVFDLLEADGLELATYDIGDNQADTNRLAVLIKKDVLEAYGEVRTADDLEKLLRALKESTAPRAPCAFSPRQYDASYSWFDLTALRLYMPQYGYYPIAGAYPLDGVSVYASTDTQELSASYNLLETEAALKAFLGLSRDGLIDFYDSSAPEDAYEGYPVILVNTQDFIDGKIMANLPALENLNFDDYYINILYNDTLPRVERIATVFSSIALCAGEDADMSTFLSFRQWLFDPENYRYFMYGVEGTDYGLDSDGNIVPNEESAYANWGVQQIFRIDALEPKSPGQARIDNFDEEMASISYPFDSSFDKARIDQTSAAVYKRSEDLYRFYTTFGQMMFSGKVPEDYEARIDVMMDDLKREDPLGWLVEAIR